MEKWKAAVRASGIPELIDFMEGLADDAEAVVNGCTESWSNGMVEGSVNPREMDQTQFLWTSRISVTSTQDPVASHVQENTSEDENAHRLTTLSSSSRSRGIILSRVIIKGAQCDHFS